MDAETRAAFDSIAETLERLVEVESERNELTKQVVTHMLSLEERVDDIADILASDQADSDFLVNSEDEIPLPPIGPLGTKES